MCEQLIRSLRFLATAEDATGMADSALAMREAAAELERLRKCEKDAERYHYIRKMGRTYSLLIPGSSPGEPTIL